MGSVRETSSHLFIQNPVPEDQSLRTVRDASDDLRIRNVVAYYEPHEKAQNQEQCWEYLYLIKSEMRRSVEEP
ncbi:jg27550 [Pararge aegeria aegeria]|uniref:Jg27550 protein n=1 Tax=Pararge aegeria aegeria TaxID=348720 RepID=A0A8S4SL00_9NEOP|nr:jg27550 [Pararge aegeria aegeria]